MGSSYSLELPFTSRFKQTRLFIKNGRAFFGLWVPLDVQIDGDEEKIKVILGQEGQLDRFADDVYGDRTLWPVIAEANQIDFPYEQVKVGMQLTIPKPANVNAALLKAITLSAQATL